MNYDLIIVGAGLYGATIAWLAKSNGLRCLVLEKRSAVGGNIQDKYQDGINVHCFGPHIFHTNDEKVWSFANKFTCFNHFHYAPLARHGKRLYNLPFNMHTFYQIFGVQTPDEVKLCLKREYENEYYTNPKNLEEKAISLVGRTIYECLIKEYTEKQWGCRAVELPSFVIERLPIRYTYNNDYFNDPHQGIPIMGYSAWIHKLLNGTEVKLNTDFLEQKAYWISLCKKVIYTGTIDSLCDYQLGELAYRSLKFKHFFHEKGNVQGCAVINETDKNIPYTRTIEHKHFEFGNQPHSIITKEYPQQWDKTKKSFYPINNEVNQNLYLQYKEMNKILNPNIVLGGRLGDYKYYNMDEVIKKALDFDLINFLKEKK